MMSDYEQLDHESFSNTTHPLFKKSIEKMRKYAQINGFQYISEAIILLYEELSSSSEVGRIMHIAPATVLKYLHRWEVDVAAPKHATKQGCMSILEIAEEIGMSKQNTFLLIQRALAKFRRNWIKMFGEPPPSETDRDFFESLLMHHGSLAARQAEASLLSEIIWEDREDDE